MEGAFVILAMAILPTFLDAIPGIFKSKSELENTPLSYVGTSVYQTLKTECHTNCTQDAYCQAYAVSYFLKTCELFNQTIGFEKPLNPRSNLYVKLKDERDGYSRVGSSYYKLFMTQMSAIEAAKNCTSQYGMLASDTSKEVYDIMVEEMRRRAIWRIWLGWRYQAEDGKWLDAEGQAMTAERWAEVGHWPSFSRICVILKYGHYEAKSEWTHEDCGNHHYYFCKIPLFKNTQSTTN